MDEFSDYQALLWALERVLLEAGGAEVDREALEPDGESEMDGEPWLRFRKGERVSWQSQGVDGEETVDHGRVIHVSFGPNDEFPSGYRWFCTIEVDKDSPGYERDVVLLKWQDDLFRS